MSSSSIAAPIASGEGVEEETQALSWKKVNFSEQDTFSSVLSLFFFYTSDLRSEFLQGAYDFRDFFLRTVKQLLAHIAPTSYSH